MYIVPPKKTNHHIDQERYLGAVSDHDTVYMYGIKENRILSDRTRVDDIWNFPWLWTKIKTDRLSFMHKQFNGDLNGMPIQMHMEMDSMFSEHDMPVIRT